MQEDKALLFSAYGKWSGCAGKVHALTCPQCLRHSRCRRVRGDLPDGALRESGARIHR
ncbi:MAG: hypothetical protein WD708_05165 [Kiritimatiellia bacterium]